MSIIYLSGSTWAASPGQFLYAESICSLLGSKEFFFFFYANWYICVQDQFNTVAFPQVESTMKIMNIHNYV